MPALRRTNPIGFLEEAFGGLARNVRNAADHMHLVHDNQETMRKIVNLMRDPDLTAAERDSGRTP